MPHLCGINVDCTRRLVEYGPIEIYSASPHSLAYERLICFCHFRTKNDLPGWQQEFHAALHVAKGKAPFALVGSGFCLCGHKIAMNGTGVLDKLPARDGGWFLGIFDFKDNSGIVYANGTYVTDAKPRMTTRIVRPHQRLVIAFTQAKYSNVFQEE